MATITDTLNKLVDRQEKVIEAQKALAAKIEAERIEASQAGTDARVQTEEVNPK